MTNRLRVTAVFVALTSAAWAACAQSPSSQPASPTRQLVAAGNENVVWLIHTTTSEAPYRGRINQFASLTPGGTAFKLLAIDPEVGRIALATVADSSLHVVFDDGTHYSYSQLGRQVEVNLPGKAMPDAIGGSPRGGRVYAMVRHRIGRQVRARQAAATTSAPATQPASDSPPAEQPRTTAPEAEPDLLADDQFDLVAYQKLGWQYVAAAEPLAAVGTPDRLWLCAADEAVHLLWYRTDDTGNIHHVAWNGRVWSADEPIRLDAELLEATVMLVENRLTVVAGMRSDNGGGTTWTLWQRMDGWQRREDLDFRDSGTAATPSPRRTAIAAFGQNLLATVMDGSQRIQSGTWSAEGGKSKRPLEVVTVFDPPPKPLVDPRTREYANLIIVVVIILLIWWRRQRSLAMPAALPAGVELANHWKRLGAFVLDLLPALLVNAWLWVAPAAAFVRELSQIGDWQNAPIPDPPARLVLGWVLVIIVHAIYCGVSEAVWGRTPGKRLLGCRPCSEVGKPASLRQIVIRNAARLLELGPYLQIWPLLLLVVLTRNHQRLGDLLAQTIVVEDKKPVDDAPHIDETA